MGHLLLAENSYPKILTIQNLKGNIDTVIAFTNEQAIKRNQEHILLKECIEYSSIQDSQLIAKDFEMCKLESINAKYITSDSLLKKSIEIQRKLLDLKDEEKQEVIKMFVDYKKKAKKENIKKLLYTTFITTPLVITFTAVATYFIIK